MDSSSGRILRPLLLKPPDKISPDKNAPDDGMARPSPHIPKAGGLLAEEHGDTARQVAAWRWMLRHASVEYLDAEEESLNCHVAESDR